jgi:8-oxo-dGTP pyrophosphatase MutT (NUDIX family)
MNFLTRARRLGVRCAYIVLRVYWFLLRPQISGVKCVLTNGDDVLLVRHAYGRRSWDLPGGTVKRGEPPIDTARREMHEELGRRIEDWVDLGELFVSTNHHRDNLHLFQASVEDRHLELDLGELTAADWFPRGDLPPDVGRFVQRILTRLDPR